jgi:hypothetical protein
MDIFTCICLFIDIGNEHTTTKNCCFESLLDEKLIDMRGRYLQNLANGDKGARARLHELGACEILARLVTAFPTNAEVLQRALCVLGLMAIHGDNKAICSAIMETSAPADAVAAVSRFPENASVTSEAMSLFWYLAWASPDYAATLAQLGACEATATVLQASCQPNGLIGWGKDSQFRSSLNFLLKLTTAPTEAVATRVVQSGVVTPLVAALRALPDKARDLCQAIAVLATKMPGSSVPAALAEAGAAEGLLAAMARLPDDKTIAGYVCLAIGAMGRVATDVGAGLDGAGACEAVAGAINKWKELSALSAVGGLARHPALGAKLGQLGACAAVVEVVEKHKRSSDLDPAALETVRFLALASPENRAQLVGLAGVVREDYFQSHGEASRAVVTAVLESLGGEALGLCVARVGLTLLTQAMPYSWSWVHSPGHLQRRERRYGAQWRRGLWRCARPLQDHRQSGQQDTQALRGGHRPGAGGGAGPFPR